MDRLVGYWDTQIIRSIVKFEFLDLISNGIDTYRTLQEELRIPRASLGMMINVLLLWNFILEDKGRYKLKYSGNNN